MVIDMSVATTAVRQAMQLEVEGNEFYTGAAETVEDRSAAATFRMLAQEEANHFGMLLRQLGSLCRDCKWVNLAPQKPRPIDDGNPLFPAAREEIRKRLISRSSTENALLLALQMETRSFDLYREEALKTSSSSGKDMYDFLASEELRHFNILMERYEQLTGPVGQNTIMKKQ